MNYKSNGFLVSILNDAAKNTDHANHGEASLYLTKFRDLETTFFKSVHPQVDVGLAMDEVRIRPECPNIYTQHGCRHVSDLVRSIDKIVSEVSRKPHNQLTVLEAYMLLCAAHVHDAGNVSGRRGHPQRCEELIRDHHHLFAGATERQDICDIASAHGGSDSEYGRDTFRRFQTNNASPPRIPLLAAILRLADELSENPDRVPELVAKYHEPAPESRLAFAYARSFKNFDFREDSLYITYVVYPDSAQLAVQIGELQVSFFDYLEKKFEIIDLEARYCSQYGWPVFGVAEVHVSIAQYSGPAPGKLLKRVSFSWPLRTGYPESRGKIFDRSPDLKDRGVICLEDCFRDQTIGGDAGSPSSTDRFIEERTDV